MSNFRVGIFAQMRWPWVVVITTLVLIWSIWFLDPISLHRNRLSTFHEPFEAELTPKNNTIEDLKYLTKRPLILYAYAETENARTNLKFFIAHALHANADFLFVFNGETNAMDLLPSSSNIRAIHRGNTCYDLGAFAEILVKDDMYKSYKRFIMMNASIRGPFIPYWSNGCWSDMFLSKITDSVKLVGMTLNCIPLIHVQSMILATDRIGIETLLFPSKEVIKKFRESLPERDPDSPVPALETPGINSCPKEYWDAVAVEVHASPLIKAAGYKLDVMMMAFHRSEAYEEECSKDDKSPNVLYENSYYGTTIHPFDTIFFKSNRKANDAVLKQLSDWTAGRKYSSYEVC